MQTRRGILVIDDGDVGGLVGCAAAGEERAAGAKAGVWADLGRPDGVLREHAVKRHAELYAIDVAGGFEALTAPVEDFGATRLLVNAGVAAARFGAGRVLWCVHHGAGEDRERPDLDAIAEACDRALLATRLLSLDVDITIDAAYADFSDVQLVELAADLDAPLETCWWALEDGSKRTPAAIAARARWTRAMEAAGFGDLLVSSWSVGNE